MMLLLLFGGFLLNKQRVPVYCRWIAKLSYFNYAYEVGASADGADAVPVRGRAAVLQQ